MTIQSAIDQARVELSLALEQLTKPYLYSHDSYLDTLRKAAHTVESIFTQVSAVSPPLANWVSTECYYQSSKGLAHDEALRKICQEASKGVIANQSKLVNRSQNMRPSVIFAERCLATSSSGISFIVMSWISDCTEYIEALEKQI